MMFDLYTNLELLARYRHEEALRHAERRRLLREAARARARSRGAWRPRPVARLAQAVGAALVALGTRLQAVGREPDAGAAPATAWLSLQLGHDDDTVRRIALALHALDQIAVSQGLLGRGLQGLAPGQTAVCLATRRQLVGERRLGGGTCLESEERVGW